MHPDVHRPFVSRAVRALILIVLIVAPLIWFLPGWYERLAVAESSGLIDPRHAEMVEADALSFDGMGVRPGDSMPALRAVALPAGNTERETSTELNKLWRDRPTVVVTASVTCDMARRHQGELDALAARFAGRVNFAILYTLEAHPTGAACPYMGEEFVLPSNIAEGIEIGEHGSLEDRADAARGFRDRLDTPIPVFLDGMDDAGWTALGAGPNIAVLIERGGRVAFKQSWVSGEKLEEQIGMLLEPHG